MSFRDSWKEIIAFQDLYYPGWHRNKPKLLFSTALAGEIGEVCDTVSHLEGGGTNDKVYSSFMVLHQCVDSYVQLVLLLARYSFSSDDFEKEFDRVLHEELLERLAKKVKVEVK
jgi:hypothetical protein